MNLSDIKNAMQQEIQKLSTLMWNTGDDGIEVLASDEIHYLSGELRLINLMIAAKKFATAVSVRTALGNQDYVDLAASIRKLDTITAKDQNFHLLLSTGAELAKAADTLWKK